jgi:anti-sigma B factor antagonist
MTTVLDEAESADSPVDSTVSSDGVTVVALRGEIDLVVVPAVRTALREVFVEGAADRVHVDLSRVEFIDSSGVGLLVWAYKQARVFQIGFALVAPTPPVSQVLRVLGVDRIIDVRHADPA